MRDDAADLARSAAGPLQTRVAERIFWDSRVDAAHVTTDVAPNGDVVLSGQVYSPREARAADDDATAAGAVHVVDHLHIAGEARRGP